MDTFRERYELPQFIQKLRSKLHLQQVVQCIKRSGIRREARKLHLRIFIEPLPIKYAATASSLHEK